MIKKIKTLSLLLLAFISISVSAQEIPDKPNPPRLVNDFAQLLNTDEANKLEAYLTQFARETSTQVVVVTTPTFDGTDVSDYAFKLGQKWGVGQKGKDNGIVMIIKPKTTAEKGRAFIATGYGLEGVLPDAICRQIVDNEMIPYFKQNNYFGGIAAGVQTVTDITRGEYTADQYAAKHKGSKSLGILGIIALIVIISIFTKSSRRHNRSNMGSGSGLPFWLLMSAMNNSSRNGGSFGNFSSGSGSFGGGGFGGFGGGGFGGGGAGGSW